MRTLPLLFALAVVSTPLRAATLRPMTTLSAPVVLLGDLFDDAGANAAHVLGPAPRPGQRIVVEAGQLAAIARQFNVDWRPASGADRAILEQPGRPLSREALLPALQAALAGAGAPPDSDIDLAGYDAPLIPLLAHPRATIEQLDFEGGSGRFAATVMIDGPAMQPMPLSISGRIEPTADVAVLLRGLPAGATVRAADVKMARVRVSLLRGEPVHDIADAVGLTLHLPARAGQPLLLTELTRPAAVTKGARVTVEIRAPGLIITEQAVALESGVLGDHVPILNPASHMIVDGEVIGGGRIVVGTGSVPVPADAQVAAR